MHRETTAAPEPQGPEGGLGLPPSAAEPARSSGIWNTATATARCTQPRHLKFSSPHSSAPSQPLVASLVSSSSVWTVDARALLLGRYGKWDRGIPRRSLDAHSSEQRARRLRLTLRCRSNDSLRESPMQDELITIKVLAWTMTIKISMDKKGFY